MSTRDCLQCACFAFAQKAGYKRNYFELNSIMNITLDEMQVFATVVDAGSITAAAQQLGLTVSACSRSLGRLEEKLETTLLRRTTRRLELTEEGQAFLHNARTIMESVERAEEQMRARRAMPSGRLRIDAASPFMLHVIVPLVQAYRARFPQVELELNSNEGIIDLLERRTDVAIRIGQLKDSTLHSRLIAYSQVRLLASPAYLAAHGQPQTMAELDRHVLLGFSEPESLNLWPLPGSDGGYLRITPTVRASSGETLRQLALTGNGIACLSDFMTAADRAAGHLLPLLPAHTQEMLQPVQAVYYRNTAVSARIASFVDFLIEALGDPLPQRQLAAWLAG